MISSHNNAMQWNVMSSVIKHLFDNLKVNVSLDFDIMFSSLRVSSLVVITNDFIEGNYLNHKVSGISLLSIILNISDNGTSVKEKI